MSLPAILFSVFALPAAVFCCLVFFIFVRAGRLKAADIERFGEIYTSRDRRP